MRPLESPLSLDQTLHGVQARGYADEVPLPPAVIPSPTDEPLPSMATPPLQVSSRSLGALSSLSTLFSFLCFLYSLPSLMFLLVYSI
jgi:hypothetical protein